MLDTETLNSSVLYLQKCSSNEVLVESLKRVVDSLGDESECI